jgi:hypothetical protein
VIGPNLASRPFLNTRPVWIATGIACAVAIMFGIVNVRLFLASNQELLTELEEEHRLDMRVGELRREVTQQLEALDAVPWRTLEGQVGTLNVVLRQHAFSWLKLLDDLERTMPYGVRMISIGPQIDEQSIKLSLKFVANNREAMLSFIRAVIADPRFSDTMPIIEDQPDEASAPGYSVSMKVVYTPERERSE